MSKSYKKLIISANRGSMSAKYELQNRQYIETGLFGLNNEFIVFRQSLDIQNSVMYINQELQKIESVGCYKDSVLLDAYSSATIEGARTTVENVKACVDNPRTKSDKMVVNTLKCQNFVYNSGIFESNIRSIWESLVDGVCENESLSGTLFRSGMVYVGNQTHVIHTPEKPENLTRKMHDLFNFCDRFAPSYVKACILHFYFVYIHPFCDGNGRFARLWMNKLLYDIDKRFKDLVISREINNSLSEYYSSLSESEFSYNNIIDITTFIEYMLDTISTAVDYLSTKRYTKLSELDNLVLSKINTDGFTVRKLSGLTGVGMDKLRNCLNRLVDNKLLCVDKSHKEYRYYKK